jgi:hypothetical protein
VGYNIRHETHINNKENGIFRHKTRGVYSGERSIAMISGGKAAGLLGILEKQ